MGSVPSWTLSRVLFAVGCLLAADTAKEVVAATLLAASPERSVARPSLPAARERSGANREVILDRNLLASSTPDLAPPPVQQEDIEKSRLTVMLLGTFAANEPSLSRATLQDRESKETLVVGVGDQIKDLALVVRIEPRRVVLRENGAPRELTLEDAEHGASRVASPSRSARSSRQAQARTQDPVGRLDEDPLAPAIAIFNPLLSQGRVLPKFEDGQVVGLEVSAIQASSLFEEIGLEDGDVITEFNGNPIDSQAKAAKILKEMSEADTYHVVGRRADGSERVWDFVRED